MSSRTGVLLLNLGTPNDPGVTSVRRYLKQFLSDPRVIELPAICRWLLLRCIILPWRARKSAQAYASIWQVDGSPLLVNSRNMQASLQRSLGTSFCVVLGMRYGQPSIAQAIDELQDPAINSIVVLPLFPQYSSAATGSALQQVLSIVGSNKTIHNLQIISDFSQHRAYIQAVAASIRPYLMQKFDYLLMSYHGLPERQLVNPGVNCYRSKCLQTSQLIAHSLGLPDGHWGTSFQSRLGRLPWIKPYTDAMLITLHAQGIKNLLICCPSFVADCLETLEEIGIRAKEQWLHLGGESLQLIPCVNAQPQWIDALRIIIGHAP